MTKPKPDADPAATALAGKRHRQTASCAQCGTPIEGLSTRRYCSDACRYRAAYLARKRAATLPAAPPEEV